MFYFWGPKQTRDGTLRIQIAQRRYHLHTLGLEVGITYALGSLPYWSKVPRYRLLRVSILGTVIMVWVRYLVFEYLDP